MASQPGEQYELGLPIVGPDARFLSDLAAVDDYVRVYARAKVSQYPNSLPAIADYEQWRQGLGWVDMNLTPNDTMNAAKAKRDAINRAQNNVTPADRNVEPGSFITPPPDSTKQPKTNWFLWGSLGVGALLLYRFAPEIGKMLGTRGGRNPG